MPVTLRQILRQLHCVKRNSTKSYIAQEKIAKSEPAYYIGDEHKHENQSIREHFFITLSIRNKVRILHLDETVIKTFFFLQLRENIRVSRKLNIEKYSLFVIRFAFRSLRS